MAAIENALPELSGPRPHADSECGDPNHSTKWQAPAILLVCLLPLFLSPALRATDLRPATSAAFDRYIAATESQMDSEAGQFLVVDHLPESQRQSAYDQLRRGETFIQELHTKEDSHSIPVPSGLVHHWVGVIFIPNATLPEVVGVLQDYENQANIYKPDVRKARLVDRNGDESEIFEQFYSKSIVTVFLNAYFRAALKPMGSMRCEIVSRSSRIVEVEDAGGPDERERTDGKDRGYMWRLNSYWRMEEKDGGVYVQNESISLSRTIPALLAWIIEPLTKSIPRDLLARMLTNTLNAVESAEAKPRPENSSAVSGKPRPAGALEVPAR